jgi:hypothetical protein
MSDRFIPIPPNKSDKYAIKKEGLGIFITAGLDDEGQPYVSINTENMKPEHRYDETTGLLGTTRPYEVGEAGQGDSYEVIAPSPNGGTPIAVHLPQPTRASARLAAKQHANMLNDLWPTVCGMPILSVHLNDGAELYDARDHNPALREEEVVDAVPDGELSNHNDLADFRAEEEKTDA